MLESVSESESLEDVLQLSNRSYSAGNRLKMCCRPSYRIRKLKNKGAILLLVRNYLVLSVFYYHTVYPNKFPSIGRLCSIVWGLSLPIAGYLADVHLGRYKIICWSIYIYIYLDYVDSLHTGGGKSHTITICGELPLC